MNKHYGNTLMYSHYSAYAVIFRIVEYIVLLRDMHIFEHGLKWTQSHSKLCFTISSDVLFNVFYGQVHCMRSTVV